MFWLAEVFNGSFSADELQRREQWARRQRAELLHQILTATGRGVARAARATGGGIRAAATRVAPAYRKYRRWQRRQAAIRELSGLSDRILQDVGLTRGDIRTVVDDMLDRKPETRGAFRVFTATRRDEAPATHPSGDKREGSRDWQRAA